MLFNVPARTAIGRKGKYLKYLRSETNCFLAPSLSCDVATLSHAKIRQEEAFRVGDEFFLDATPVPYRREIAG